MKLRRKTSGATPMRLARTPGRRIIGIIGALTASAVPLLAQASPWEDAVNVVQISFTGPIARGLSLVAIVVGGSTPAPAVFSLWAPARTDTVRGQVFRQEGATDDLRDR